MSQRGLNVSCQAPTESSFRGSRAMHAVAQETVAAGATGICIDGSENIRAVKGAVESPVVGIYEYAVNSYKVDMTSDTRRARIVVRADSDIITLGVTLCLHQEGTAENVIQRIKAESGLPVFGDVSIREEGVVTASASVDYSGTTFLGYTVDTSAIAVKIPWSV